MIIPILDQINEYNFVIILDDSSSAVYWNQVGGGRCIQAMMRGHYIPLPDGFLYQVPCKPIDLKWESNNDEKIKIILDFINHHNLGYLFEAPKLSDFDRKGIFISQAHIPVRIKANTENSSALGRVFENYGGYLGILSYRNNRSID